MPGVTEEPAYPTLAVPAPAVPPPRVPVLPGARSPEVPAVLRSEGVGDGESGRDGARGVMVVAIGIAVAALRGMNQWLGDRRQRFQDEAPVREAAAKAKAEQIKARAEHAAALQQIHDGAAQARTKGRVQSPAEFGRSAVKGGGKPGAGSAGGAKGPAPKGRTGANTSAGPSAKKTLDAPKPGKTAGKLSSASGPGRNDGSKGPGGKGTGSKGPDKASNGIKSPKGGKSSNSGSSPAVERARSSQKRAAARQGAKDQRRGDRQAARLENRAKDRDAARARTNGAKEARQQARGRVRNARIEAKGARKEKARDARFEAKRKKKKEKRKKAAAAPDRTTLAQATAKQARRKLKATAKRARRRLKERRKDLAPPIISKAKKKNGKGKAGNGSAGPGSAAAPKVDLKKRRKPPAGPGAGAAPKVDLRKKPKPSAGPPGGAAAPKVNLKKPKKPKKPTAGGKPGWRPFGRKKPKAGPMPKPKPTNGKKGGPTGGGSAKGPKPGSRSRRNRQHQPPPRQGPQADGQWLRPPPGMTATYSVTITRPDREQPKKTPSAITRGRLGLPAGSPPPSSTTTTAGPTGPAPTPRKEARPMGGAPAVPDTQFTDADLTVYDVIDSDKDQAEEILAGAAHAKIVADRCEQLVSSLESLRTELVAKSVPGSLIGWCARLIERAGVVESRAEGLAKGLPRASEAIAHAGQVAADYDQHPADVTRDLGHTAPADASYHQE
ncbi:hypothetical protein [Streptomyces syringium]|uniref:hypothetical protein n=1 Tax=Streptomyces syringium TaxID=76729 RepID=UPI0037CE034C